MAIPALIFYGFAGKSSKDVVSLINSNSKRMLIRKIIFTLNIIKRKLNLQALNRQLVYHGGLLGTTTLDLCCIFSIW